MAMSKAEVEIKQLAAVATSIKKHWPELLKRLPGRELMPTLYSKRLLSDINKEDFQVVTKVSKQNTIILDVMMTKGCSDFEMFLQTWEKEEFNVDLLQRLTASYEGAKQDIPESDEKKPPAISKGSEPTQTRPEKMMYGDYIPNFDEKFKRLTSSAKAICRISPDFEKGTTTGFVTRFKLLDDSPADFLVTCIHTFVTAAERAETRDYTSILFPHSRDGAKDQPQQISPAIRKRILNCKYKFWSAETARRGCDILYEEPGQLNFFADAKNDVVVLRLAASPKGVKPLKFKSEKQYDEARPIKEWYYASVDIFGYFGGADCLEHAEDPKICRNACLRYSQGVVCPEEGSVRTMRYWVSTPDEGGFSGSPVLATTYTVAKNGNNKLWLCPVAVHCGAYLKVDNHKNYGTYFLPIAQGIQRLLYVKGDDSLKFEEDQKTVGVVALEVNFKAD